MTTSATEDAACRRREDCRLCGSRDVALAFALKPTPPANAFVPASPPPAPQRTFPLDVFFCRSCGHVQLLDVVDPRALFEHYVYVSGTSPSFVRHFDDYAAAVVRRTGAGAGGLVVDIGSNDGTLLKAFKNHGLAVLGIDPAKEISARATAEGVETWIDFFSDALARRIRDERGPAAVVTANNVFAHADDLAGIAEGVAALLASDGIFVFEVSYLLDVYEKVLFDTIYHEHLAYHAVAPLIPFLRRHGLELFAVERVGSHGGSLRGYARRAESKRWPVEASVGDAITQEAKLGLDRLETFVGFAKRIDALKAELGRLLGDLKAKGKRIAGFGAPAKATTLMYHFGLGPDTIEFIVDDSPWKQGLLSPGLHIPVVSADAIYDRRPDYMVLLAWNFAEPIIQKHARYVAEGGHFIVPLPKLEVH